MASGISTTSRFCGILLGFAVLSGILSTATHAWLAGGLCEDMTPCGRAQPFADAVVAGDLPRALAGLAEPARALAVVQARHGYAHGFSAALVAASLGAALSALLVGWLMRRPRASVPGVQVSSPGRPEAQPKSSAHG